MTYKPTIGLEIHAELKTKTKMFCDSKNDPNEKEPNVNICPVCMAHPGTLPVVNGEAVHHVLRVGTAIGGTLADYTEFDRKNYFYPDLPKGYQISQYEYPLISGGELVGVELTRIHLEEDTASSVHDEKTGATLIDYNRAGVPLMELVTEPVIQSAEKAGEFARELQLLLRYLGASDANMEKGEMRVEANISVSNSDEKGTKVEVKNLNSFRAMERAVAYEIKRQTALLEQGEVIKQETLGWDENKQQTFPQRIKEGSADYRYFPDPDIPSFRLSEVEHLSDDILKNEMPELPWERRERYVQLGISGDDADMYVQNSALGAFADAVFAELDAKEGSIIQLASNYIATDLAKLIRDNEKTDTEIKGQMTIDPKHFMKLIRMIEQNELSSRGAKDVLALMVKKDDDPEVIAKERGLLQTSDAASLLPIVKTVLEAHVEVVADYKRGKESALQFLIGQGMKESKGSANPEILKKLFEQLLSD